MFQTIYPLFVSLAGIYRFTHGKQSDPWPDQMTSFDVKDEYQCALLCTKNPDCEHFNLIEQGTSKVCQLLLYTFDGTLKEDSSVTHYSLQKCKQMFERKINMFLSICFKIRFECSK